MDNNYQLLVLRDNAKHELEQIKSIEDGIPYLNKLKAIEIWVKAEKKDAELQNLVAEQKLRTQRILGELIEEGQRKGTIKTEVDNRYSTANKVSTVDLGITHRQSSNFQNIASIPEDDFEEFIKEKKQAVNNAVSELTTTGAVRLARSIRERKDDLKAGIDLSDRVASEKELRDLAKEVNMKYTKEERRFFVTLIKQ